MPAYPKRQKKDNRTSGGPADGPCPIPPRPLKRLINKKKKTKVTDWSWEEVFSTGAGDGPEPVKA
ncbi:hypothetical protein FRC11_004677 [Ceratobasidium sp. 423]|nr:hypothetical protein FRC11_004677 [Ceratobasidium sp. 423]